MLLAVWVESCALLNLSAVSCVACWLLELSMLFWQYLWKQEHFKRWVKDVANGSYTQPDVPSGDYLPLFSFLNICPCMCIPGYMPV